MVALENMRSRFNSAAGPAEPGLFGCLRAAARRTVGAHVDRHERPPTRRTSSSPTATCSSRSPTRCSARPPTPRTCCRRPGCAGSTSTAPRCATTRAYLVRITTRLALNRMRTISRRRESYVGPWLPEPLLTTPDVAEDVELADSVSMAMLTGARDAGARPSGRCSCCARSSTSATTRSRPRSTRRRPPYARSRTGPAATSPSAARARGDAGRERDAVLRAVHGRRVDRRPPEPAGRARPRRRADHRRRRREEGRAAADPRRATRCCGFLAGGLRGRRPRPTSWSSTAPRRCGSSSTASSTRSSPCVVEDGLVTGLYVVRNPAKLARLDAVGRPDPAERR